MFDLKRVALDAMGGDYAPTEIVRGGYEAAKKGLAKVILVGNRESIDQELATLPKVDNLSIVHASEVIGMDEQPATALRKKKDASILVATRMVKEEEADALVSAGSTGAQMAAALLSLGRVPGIQRPAIATILPTLNGGKVILDVGANVDCRPQQLVQFAYMGSIYTEKILDRARPKVGLLNIGTEETKGNEATLAAYELLKQSDLNFIGNVEAREIMQGDVDVIVCDGFVGNTLLKFGEGMVGILFGLLQREFQKNLRSRMGAALLLPGLKAVKNGFDYAEYGGAPLLGVQGVSIICHGSSRARAITNAIRLAVKCTDDRFVERIAESI
ncbi:MAG: phosphate acyltransferase PlsX [Bacillota bacterium]